MARPPSKSKRFELDDQIDAAWNAICNDRIRVRVPEHQRQRALNPDGDNVAPISSGNLGVDQQMLGQLTTVNLTLWDIVSTYKNAGSVHFMKPEDQVSAYETIRKYLIMWGDRTQAFPDEPHPPMTDFIMLDEFVESHHPEYQLTCFINHKPVAKDAPRGIGNQMRAAFGGGDPAKNAAPVFTATRYESTIKRFHENVWGGNRDL